MPDDDQKQEAALHEPGHDELELESRATEGSAARPHETLSLVRGIALKVVAVCVVAALVHCWFAVVATDQVGDMPLPTQ